MNWFERFLLPHAAATHASDVDGLFMFIIYLTIFFFLFQCRSDLLRGPPLRRRSPNDVTPHVTHNTKLELVWSIIPLLVVMMIFFWGFKGYIKAAVAPNDATEIVVTAKKWFGSSSIPTAPAL